MDTSQLLNTTKDKMQKALVVVQGDLATIRTGRATPALIENIKISAYDDTVSLRLAEMATIASQDGRTLIVSPFDISQIKAVAKGIQSADVNLTPVIDGKIIRLTVPPLTEDRRKEYIKLARAKTEGGRVMIRQIRHDTFSQIKRAYEDDKLNDDEKKFIEDKIQQLIDSTINELEVIAKRKEEELGRV